MTFNRTDAIVLKKVAYGESDWVVTFLTNEGSRLTGFAPGARRSHRRFNGNLDLFNYLDIACKNGHSGKMTHLDGADIRIGMEEIRKDLSKFAAACYFSEMVLLFLPEKESSHPLFQSFLELLKRLNRPEPFSSHLIPLMEHRFLTLFGYQPVLDCCVECKNHLSAGKDCFFNGVKGGVVCSSCASHQQGQGTYPLSFSAVERILHDLSGSPEDWTKSRWTKQEVSQARKALEFFIQYTAGRPLQSLKFLSQVIS